MNKPLLILNTAVSFIYGPTLWSQHTPTISTTALVKPLTGAPTMDNITGTLTMIVNRSRVLKNKVDGAGTRYFSVTDSDLVGKTRAEVVERVTPSVVTPQQKARTMDVLVNIGHPLFVTNAGKTPFMIGTAIIEGKVHELQVNSNITLGELKINKK